MPVHSPAREAGVAGAGAVAWVAPFAAFVGFMAIEKVIPLSPGVLYPLRAGLVLAVMLVFSRRGIPWSPRQALASGALGVGVFAIWIGPDLIWPGCAPLLLVC